jgi:hypothetical protein
LGRSCGPTHGEPMAMPWGMGAVKQMGVIMHRCKEAWVTLGPIAHSGNLIQWRRLPNMVLSPEIDIPDSDVWTIRLNISTSYKGHRPRLAPQDDHEE